MELALNKIFEDYPTNSNYHRRLLDSEVVSYYRIPKKNVLLVQFKASKIDIYNIGQVKEIIDTAYNLMVRQYKESFDVILECREIEYIDSSVVGALLYSWKQLHKKGKQIVLCDVSPIIEDTLHKLKLMEFFKIYDSIEDSVYAL
jgi:anti-anti-sigma factor